MLSKNIISRPLKKSEEGQYKELMQNHHYLGFMPEMSETMGYVATLENEWLSRIRFSAARFKMKSTQ